MQKCCAYGKKDVDKVLVDVDDQCPTDSAPVSWDYNFSMDYNMDMEMHMNMGHGGHGMDHFDPTLML